MDVAVQLCTEGKSSLKNHSSGRSITTVINFIADNVEIGRKPQYYKCNVQLDNDVNSISEVQSLTSPTAAIKTSDLIWQE